MYFLIRFTIRERKRFSCGKRTIFDIIYLDDPMNVSLCRCIADLEVIRQKFKNNTRNIDLYTFSNFLIIFIYSNNTELIDFHKT